MKKHIPLLIGIALPIIFIITISLVIFTPSLSVKPEHDFIYSNENISYYSGYSQFKNTYKIVNNKIELSPIELSGQNLLDSKQIELAPKLFLYNVQTDTSHEIGFEEAQKFALDPGPSSPDGYSIEYSYSHEGIFEIFGSDGNNQGYFIGKNNARKKLATSNANGYLNNGSFSLIGWVK